MLNIGAVAGQTITVGKPGEEISIVVKSVRGSKVCLGIEAPRNFNINRNAPRRPGAPKEGFSNPIDPPLTKRGPRP